MATNLSIDQNLLEEALKIGKHSTKKAAVNAALEEYINHRKQLEILSLFNTIEYEKGYDYKSLRSR
ncbi:MAG: type II toxin-antitoxin system VapB family antitoxin [Bacteroidota bacterium]